MQVVLSATSSRLSCMLEDIHISADTLLQNICFLISILVQSALSLPTKITFGVVKVSNIRYHCS